ncbi:MAG TPA: TraR/DksA family transcriptional regulator [Terriglobales bacterium]|nr:TraR/DksA family transcriptional regulator [Terriglobales bacterium]
MNNRIMDELEHALIRKRAGLLRGVAGSQEELTAIETQQESEFEEAAQRDRITRLTSRLGERDRQKIREIDAALERVARGNYGKCANCSRKIKVQRLRAMPTATLCVICAAAREGKQRSAKTREPSERLPGYDVGELDKPPGLD